MIKIIINESKSKKQTAIEPVAKEEALFLIKGNWFIAKMGSGTESQVSLLMVNPSAVKASLKVSMKFLKDNPNYDSPCMYNEMANYLIQNDGVLAMASYDDASALGHGNCSGAKEVIRLAGSGYGQKMMYLCFAAAYPSPVTIDREEVSGGFKDGEVVGAQGTMKKLNAKFDNPLNFNKHIRPTKNYRIDTSDNNFFDTVKRIQSGTHSKWEKSIGVFDDKDNPTTTPKDDDCHKEYYADFLNRAYIDNSYSSELVDLRGKGQDLLATIKKMFATVPERNLSAKELFKNVTQNYFRLKFSGYLPDCNEK